MRRWKRQRFSDFQLADAAIVPGSSRRSRKTATEWGSEAGARIKRPRVTAGQMTINAKINPLPLCCCCCCCLCRRLAQISALSSRSLKSSQPTRRNENGEQFLCYLLWGSAQTHKAQECIISLLLVCFRTRKARCTQPNPTGASRTDQATSSINGPARLPRHFFSSSSSLIFRLDSTRVGSRGWGVVSVTAATFSLGHPGDYHQH